MKNYKKIYQRLIKEIKRFRDDEQKSQSIESDERLKFLDYIESRYAVTVINSILEMNEEIEGKQCNLVIMNQKEFNLWKKQIKK